jgi:hypothetical protein
MIIISSTPTKLSSDKHPLFEFHCWETKLRVFNLEKIKAVPSVPMSHAFVMRLRAHLEQAGGFRPLSMTIPDRHK